MSGKNIKPLLKAKKCCEKLISQLHKKIPIIYVKSNYQLGEFGEGKSICVKDTKGAAFAIDSRCASEIITKTKYSAFDDSGFVTLLKKKKIKTILIIGVTTENCVRSTALDAINNNYKVILIEDCVATNSERKNLHDQALEEMRQQGIKTINSNDLNT